MNINPRTQDAYQLFHNGVLALARAELQGIRVDMDYIERKRSQLSHKVIRLEEDFKDTKFFKHWQHTVKGTVNINSNAQLSNFLYKTKGIQVTKETESGQGATDEEALQQMNIPELNQLLEIYKLKKVRDTYLGSFAREQIDGYIHPFFNLHIARTYRSCVAKGTPVLAVRDFIKYPKGVPIEEIKKGDFVYCFDDNLNPTIRKVLWAGKTGLREVIRVHYTVHGGGGKGFLDITPEHEIRLINGYYEQAQNLIGDFRGIEESHHLSKIRTLSCKRWKDTLNFTGHLKGGHGILEHRLIYSQLIGNLTDEDIIHHENENHLDHTPSNLKKTNLSANTSYHTRNSSDEVKQKRIQSLNNNRHKIIHKSGSDHPNYLGLSKFTCYKLLASASGKLIKVNYDFNTFKRYLKLHSINPCNIKIRYDKHGNYIWKKQLKILSKLGRAKVSKILGHNYYKLIQLYKISNIDTSRRWGNQCGSFKPGNHNITKIEWIGKIVDVYDIEVEEFHNFFANEICVHNSADHPNFQNIPIRDVESMRICRKALYPRPGHQLLEIDFKGIEVVVNACYNKDSTLIKYITNSASDMHSDMTKQIFKVDNFSKSIPEHNVLRQAVKNGFVFPEFYGDYYKNCTVNMLCNWGKLPQGRFHPGVDEGISMPQGSLADHLINVGLPSFKVFEAHLQKIEKDFWEKRFPEYAEWKIRWYNIYKKYGYFDTLTGFRCSGVLGKNDVTNYPAQGSAFHCLLWSFNELDRILFGHSWDTKLVGQIHDSAILDVNPKELTRIVKVVQRVTCRDLSNAWKWIIVPLHIDMELSPVDKSWAEKKKFEL